MENARTVARRMAEMLAAQLQRYEQVLDLSREQVGCIDGGAETGRLMELLGRKQRLIQEVQAASAGAAGLLAAWETAKEAIPAEERAAIEEAHAAVKSVLEDIVRLEEQGREQMERSAGDQGKKIADLQKGKKMLKAYGAAPPPAHGRFTDNRK